MAKLFINLNSYQYLNALLKVNDIIISNGDSLNQNEMNQFKVSVNEEYKIIQDELSKRGLK